MFIVACIIIIIISSSSSSNSKYKCHKCHICAMNMFMQSDSLVVQHTMRTKRRRQGENEAKRNKQ